MSPESSGICSRLCEVSAPGDCPEGQGCRPVEGDRENEIGECRVQCSPDGSYSDSNCPEGRRSCRPEASLVPLGDGINTGYGVEEEQPYCWASGDLAAGASCNPGQCAPGHECLFGRSRQSDLVSTLLSPYFSSGGAAPICRPICDPFDGHRADHRCTEGETCLFNYPWSADLGHCAPIIEDRAPGESCEHPGMACGEDSICVIDGGPPVCMRFCQFMGSDAAGYGQSSCSSGYECAPFVENIGVCRILG